MSAPFKHRGTGFKARGVAVVAAFAIAALGAGPVAEETLVIDAASTAPGSPRQWQFDGAIASSGPAGPVLGLSPTPADAGEEPDLRLSFDEAPPGDPSGKWTLEVVGPVSISPSSRFGAGAGSFRAPATRLVLQPASVGVFTPNMPIGDMSLEFWLKPTRADSGEIVMLWKANRKAGSSWLPQQVTCLISRNRMTFGFINFFADPSGKATTLSLQGSSVVVPAAWSHHLVRFDSSTGLVEYLMNGEIEAVAYATSTGKQAGAVWSPMAGDSGRLEVAPNYTGLIDELRIVRTFISAPRLGRYGAAGGTAVSPIFDLGGTNSLLKSIEADAMTPAESAVHWSYRIGDSSAGWGDDEPAWVPFSPGVALSRAGAEIRGRYLQLRMDLYPDASGELSPTVSTIRARFEPDLPPSPPAMARAKAGDGSIAVSWSPLTEADIAGYVVYYGSAPGDYFGADAREGRSPIFVPGGSASGLTLTGLKNGSLYFLAVAAYDGAHPPHIGDSSREISARPSRVSP